VAKVYEFFNMLDLDVISVKRTIL